MNRNVVVGERSGMWSGPRDRDRVLAQLRSDTVEAAASVRRGRPRGTDHADVPTAAPRGSQGKSDLVDSVAIARIVASGEVLPSAYRLEVLADIRALVEYRDQLVRARTRVANRTLADLVNVLPGYERRVPNLRAKAHRATARSLLREDRSVRAELIRKRLGELSRLEGEITAMDRRIRATVHKTGTSLTSIPGVGPFIAAKILGEVGDPSRIRSKPAFAVLSGTAPLSASSGQVQRHRLNRGGNRQLNWALHYIALVQCRIMPEAQAYMARQREAGKSHKEVMRCLKRQLSNVVYRHLVADARRAELAA
jgi:transposase